MYLSTSIGTCSGIACCASSFVRVWPHPCNKIQIENEIQFIPSFPLVPSQLGFHGLSSVPVPFRPLLVPPGLPSPMSSVSVAVFPSFSSLPPSGPPARSLGCPGGLPRPPASHPNVVCRPSFVGPCGLSMLCGSLPPPFPPLPCVCPAPLSSPVINLASVSGYERLHTRRRGSRGGV